MTICLSVCHKDIYRAIEWLRWVSFLSSESGISLKPWRLVLFVSHIAARTRAAKTLVESADCFGEVDWAFPKTTQEVRYPGGANMMHRESLTYVRDKYNDDCLWLEPDTVPIHPEWANAIAEEWKVAKARGCEFMGHYVEKVIPHLTGNAVYSKDWQRWAPSLMDCPDNWAFDVWAGKDILPKAHITTLIQHGFRMPDPESTDVVLPGTAIYHRDKVGRLPYLLSEQRYAGRFKKPAAQEDRMTRCYHTYNATKPLKVADIEVKWDRYGMQGGVWAGVMQTDDEIIQSAMQALVGSFTITEITPEKYTELSKKKLVTGPKLYEGFDLHFHRDQRSKQAAPHVESAIATSHRAPPIETVAEAVTVQKVAPPHSESPNIPKKRGRPPKAK